MPLPDTIAISEPVKNMFDLPQLKKRLLSSKYHSGFVPLPVNVTVEFPSTSALALSWSETKCEAVIGLLFVFRIP